METNAKTNLQTNLETNTIHFEKATLAHKDCIFQWLEKPHVKEFWDNSQDHRDDILYFMQNKKRRYFNGIADYWVGSIGDAKNTEPYCFLLTTEVLATQPDLKASWREHLSITGKTFTIDFMIGNEKYLGKGLGAPTLEAFTQFMHDNIDQAIDTFMIDPDVNNPRAQHVYEKAGFKTVAEFDMTGGFFKGHKSLLMVKKL